MTCIVLLAGAAAVGSGALLGCWSIIINVLDKASRYPEDWAGFSVFSLRQSLPLLKDYATSEYRSLVIRVRRIPQIILIEHRLKWSERLMLVPGALVSIVLPGSYYVRVRCLLRKIQQAESRFQTSSILGRPSQTSTVPSLLLPQRFLESWLYSYVKQPNDRTHTRRADDVNRESGTESAIRRCVQ